MVAFNIPLWKKWAIFLLLAILSIFIGILDFLVDPLLDIQILYLIPLAIAAWTLGRPWAWVIVAIDIVPTYLFLIGLYELGQITMAGLAANVVVRILVYGFVAELVYQLVRGRHEIREILEAQDIDLEAARALQLTVLTNPMPDIEHIDIASRTIYASAIGGDFQEAVQLEGNLHISIGDVTGKGVQASLFTTLVKHLLEQSRRIFDNPSDILNYINNQLTRALPGIMFVSLFYGKLDTDRQELTYVNAGHEPPLLFKRASNDFAELDVSSVILGVEEYTDPPKVSRAILLSGDILLAFTDGITEAKRASGEMLGTDLIKDMALRLKNSSASEIVEGIISEIEKATVQKDDLAILCIKILPRHQESL